jgi:outer membrane protein OmpA-like peptidoglycan-associated protein
MIRLALAFCLMPLILSAQLNSPFDEQNPILTPDGQELYFTIGHHPQNVSALRDPGDIWVSQKVDGKWSLPVLAKGLINNGGYNAVLGFSADGKEMYLYGHYTYNGGMAGSQGVSVSQRSPGGWSLPHNEEVLYFLNKSVATGGYITPDKKVFIFSATTNQGYGNEDIYVSFNQGDKWTEPKNLGASINSIRQEMTPWISDDLKTIYFSSNSDSGLGSFDVFSSERKDDTWTNWSAPQNMGSTINSRNVDLYYHPYPSTILFTSSHNSDGYGDIIEVNNVPTPQAESPKPTPSQSTPVTIAPAATPSGLTLYGKVLNASNSLGIQSQIVFHSNTSVPITTSINGDYKISIDPKLDYSIRVEAVGYMGLYEKLNLPPKDLNELEINFKLQPVAVGASMNLRNVLFKQSSPELLPESNDELEMVVDFLKLNPSVEIELSGHTDNSGKASLNLKLSRDRAIRIKNYLVEKGIDARRIKGVGYGETKPIASNKTDEGKRLNRRVEFKIISVK